MDTKISSLLPVLALLCLFSSTSHAFNITRILDTYPEYSTFNSLLSQTGLAKKINSRRTITVLAVDDVGDLAGKDIDLVGTILSSHVILDYYDNAKFARMKRSKILTTLYQTTGEAQEQNGFLNCTKTPNGIMFGSATKGAPLVSSLMGVVFQRPYNISVLQVSSVIEAPGLEDSPPPPHSRKRAPPPRHHHAEAPEPEEAPTPTPAPAPADASADDEDDGDDEADSPDSDSSDEAAAPAPRSGSSRVHVGFVAVVAGLVSCMMGLL
ncbi:hypothetical protein Tsubulata_026892 [Turnera subulata]|uniref:FAS1 domain-containing protein n=1 Tax=Turnera subulata TaxID=218843 RepID=A0A9Q0FLF2_9ROSI|nr:hypothetical protein Tsubulata_026892 [Turnera subulata]